VQTITNYLFALKARDILAQWQRLGLKMRIDRNCALKGQHKKMGIQKNQIINHYSFLIVDNLIILE
jgi:hypothetical protein